LIKCLSLRHINILTPTKALELAKNLGAEIVWIKNDDVPNAIIRYIKSHNINKIIIGKPKKFPIFRGSIFRKIAQNTKYVDIFILDPPIAEAELFNISKKRISLPKLYLPKIYNIFIGLFLVFLATFIGLQWELKYLCVLNLNTLSNFRRFCL
jgi:two-component system sensor histidine kinase KdpD